MNKKIAILRGINVGGRRKILMADLKALCATLGFDNVTTYIQSGNVVFNTTLELTNQALATKMEQAITAQYGFEVPVLIRSSKALAQAVASNPFYQNKDVDIKQLHLTFLKEQPDLNNRLKTESYHFEPDKFVIKEKEVFIFCSGKYHQSKLTNNFFEKKLKVSATTRNWKTVLKLLEISS